MATTVIAMPSGWDYRHLPHGHVYIGRPSKWGNPYRISEGWSRDEAVDKFEEYLMNNPELMAALPELKDKVLVCYCKPRRCHGDVLAKILNA